MFAKLICWLFGHDLFIEDQEIFELNTPEEVVWTYCRCSRCLEPKTLKSSHTRGSSNSI